MVLPSDSHIHAPTFKPAITAPPANVGKCHTLACNMLKEITKAPRETQFKITKATKIVAPESKINNIALLNI